MINAYRDFWTNYFNFGGRTSRGSFWWFILCNILVVVVICALLMLLLGPEITTTLASLYGLATVIPGIAISVRRLHDIGRSGWWVLLPLIPIIGSLVLLYFYLLPSR
ncbi:MAG: DUF805 domain-containing protein [Planctomycetota bacterium]|nr:DUF805 domain-containing protein [Planctomycetota bacterium]